MKEMSLNQQKAILLAEKEGFTFKHSGMGQYVYNSDYGTLRIGDSWVSPSSTHYNPRQVSFTSKGMTDQEEEKFVRCLRKMKAVHKQALEQQAEQEKKLEREKAELESAIASADYAANGERKWNITMREGGYTQKFAYATVECGGTYFDVHDDDMLVEVEVGNYKRKLKLASAFELMSYMRCL